MGDVNQLAYSFKGRRLGYKYRVLRQRIRPVMERISSDQKVQLLTGKSNRHLRAKSSLLTDGLEKRFAEE